MHSKFRPERFPVQSGTAKSIFATENAVGVIDTNGKIGYLNDEFISGSDKKGDVFVVVDENLKNPTKIGGSGTLRFALVKN